MVTIRQNIQSILDTLLTFVLTFGKKVQLHANIDFSTVDDQPIITAPGAGYRIRICHLLIMTTASTADSSEIKIKSGSTTIKTVVGPAVELNFSEHCNLGTNEALVLKAEAADRVVGGVDYYIEAV